MSDFRRFHLVQQNSVVDENSSLVLVVDNLQLPGLPSPCVGPGVAKTAADCQNLSELGLVVHPIVFLFPSLFQDTELQMCCISEYLAGELLASTVLCFLLDSVVARSARESP